MTADVIDVFPHTPNLDNGKTMFNAGGCTSCHATPKQEDRTRLGGGLGLLLVARRGRRGLLGRLLGAQRLVGDRLAPALAVPVAGPPLPHVVPPSRLLVGLGR